MYRYELDHFKFPLDMMKFSGDNVLEIRGNISHIEPDSILIRKITNMENHKLDTNFFIHLRNECYVRAEILTTTFFSSGSSVNYYLFT